MNGGNTMSDVILETYAKMAAIQMIDQYIPAAKKFGLTKEQIIWMIRRVAILAVEILDKQPS